MRRNMRWAAGFQSSDAAVNAVHVLYYNTRAELGNDLGGLVRHIALPPLCWTGIMAMSGRLSEVAPDEVIGGPASGLLGRHIMRNARRH